ncbi:MAG: Hpt domain-containing protein [Ignavibacteria bacterium]|nr:Hpt domain-containing protein [Ignavibacteria bacterium]
MNISYNRNKLLNRETIKSLKELGSVDGKLFLNEIMKLYICEADKLLTQMESQINKKNFDDLKISSHTLKGASANIGAVEVSALSSRIEELSKKTDDSNLQDLYNALNECYKLTKKELENLIS